MFQFAESSEGITSKKKGEPVAAKCSVLYVWLISTLKYMLASTDMMRGRWDNFRIISVSDSEFIECEYSASDDVEILHYFKEIFK